MKNQSTEKSIQRIKRSIKKWGDPNHNKAKALEKLLNINNGEANGKNRKRTNQGKG